jgi:hypothetical protein
MRQSRPPGSGTYVPTRSPAGRLSSIHSELSCDRDRLLERRARPPVAALGIPWLPQTVLIPVRHKGSDPDDPERAMQFGAEHAPAFLDANPDLQLHHMHDPNQDRLMLHGMAYFRVKSRCLGSAYERFITSRLRPGGTIIVTDCRLSWPTTRVSARHVFQFGGFGGATIEEYLCGGERTTAFLAQQGSRRRRWSPPLPDGSSPEAEWGFEPRLSADLERLARERGYRILRLRFDEPDDLAAPVADLHRLWYARSGVPARRVLAEFFVLLDPWLAVRTRSVPSGRPLQSSAQPHR